MGSFALTNVNIDSGVITGITDLAVADGGTGASNLNAFILADGSNALSGAWDMGSQNLTNVNIDSGSINNVSSLTIGTTTTSFLSNGNTIALDFKQSKDGAGLTGSGGFFNYDSGAGQTSAALFFGGKAGGTEASPSRVANGDVLFVLGAVGYDDVASGFLDAGGINWIVDGTTSDGVLPSRLIFKVNSGGATSTEIMRANRLGNMLIGTGATDALGKLHVEQDDTAPATEIPSIYIEQADVDADFFSFLGTSDTNVDRALVDAANFTTPGSIVGWLKIHVEDLQSTAPITDGDYYIPFYSAPSA
jgi:hypothetical protein